MGDTSPSVSPDGRRLLFARFIATGVADLYLLDLTAGFTTELEPERLTSLSKLVFGPAWISDVDVVFSRQARLKQLAIDSREESSLTHWESGLARAEEVAYSHARRRLAYRVRNIGWNIRSVNLAEPGRLRGAATFVAESTRLDLDPGISRDGKRIAYRSDRTGSPEIWVSNSNGSSAVRLTNLQGPQTESPVWSPDDREIAFDSRTGDVSTIYVIDAQGGAPRRLTEGERPAWSPDGASIYFTSNRSGRFEIWRIPTGGGGASQVTKDGGVRPRFSPDGQQLYFSQRYQLGPLMRASPNGQGVEEVLPLLITASSYAVGDRGVYYVTDNVIRYLDFRSGEDRDLLALDRPHGWGMDLAPGGKTLFWSEITTDESDLVYVDDFVGATSLAR